MQFTIDSNSTAIAQALSRAAQEIADTTPLMAAIGKRLEMSISERFDTKTDPSGKAWEPYKAISAAIHKARTGKDISGSLLDRTGIMRGGIEHHASADQVEVGLTAPYAAFHEFGTGGRKAPIGGGPFKPGTKGIGPIPRRGMVFGAVSGQGQGAQVTQALSAGDDADVLAIIERHIRQATSGL